jgi:ribosomal protein S18 acetylase RimI-like enzyme
VRYAFEILKAKKVTLGVLENNPGAYHCYKAAGFRDVTRAEPEYYHLLGQQVKCLELEQENA